MATPTVRDVIRRSMLLIGAIAVGETPSDEEAADGLQTLNDMLDSWATERLLLFTIKKQVINFTPALAVHTVGPAGTINITRPPRIERATVNVGGVDLPIDFVEHDRWSRIPMKSVQGIPHTIWDDGAFPTRNLSVYPVPALAYTGALYTWNPVTQFASVNDQTVFPPGYLRAVRYCLAVELAGEYEKDVPASVLAVAVQAKGVVKSLNTPKPVMECDPALVSPTPFNIQTG